MANLQQQAADALFVYLAHGVENQEGWLQEALRAFFNCQPCPDVWYDDEGKINEG